MRVTQIVSLISSLVIGTSGLAQSNAKVLEDSTYSFDVRYELFDLTRCEVNGCESFDDSGPGDFSVSTQLGLCKNPTFYSFDGEEEFGFPQEQNNPDSALVVGESRDELHRGLDSVTFTLRRFDGEMPITPGPAIAAPNGFVYIPTIYIGLEEESEGPLQAPRGNLVTAVNIEVTYDNGFVDYFAVDLESESLPGTPCDKFQNVLNIYDENDFLDEMSAASMGDGMIRIRLFERAFVSPFNPDPFALPGSYAFTVRYERGVFADDDGDRDADESDVDLFTSAMFADSDLSLMPLGAATAMNDDNGDGRITIRDFQRLQHSARTTSLAPDGSVPAIAVVANPMGGDDLEFTIDDPNDLSQEVDEFIDTDMAYAEWLRFVDGQIKKAVAQLLKQFEIPDNIRQYVSYIDDVNTTIVVKHAPDLANYMLEFRFGGASTKTTSLYLLPYATEPGGSRIGIDIWAKGYDVDRFFADPLLINDTSSFGPIRTWGQFLQHGFTGMQALAGVLESLDPSYHSRLVLAQAEIFCPAEECVDQVDCPLGAATFVMELTGGLEWAFGSYAWAPQLAGNPLLYIDACILLFANLDEEVRRTVAQALATLSSRLLTEG